MEFTPRLYQFFGFVGAFELLCLQPGAVTLHRLVHTSAELVIVFEPAPTLLLGPDLGALEFEWGSVTGHGRPQHIQSTK